MDPIPVVGLGVAAAGGRWGEHADWAAECVSAAPLPPPARAAVEGDDGGPAAGSALGRL